MLMNYFSKVNSFLTIGGMAWMVQGYYHLCLHSGASSTVPTPPSPHTPRGGDDFAARASRV